MERLDWVSFTEGGGGGLAVQIAREIVYIYLTQIHFNV